MEAPDLSMNGTLPDTAATTASGQGQTVVAIVVALLLFHSRHRSASTMLE